MIEVVGPEYEREMVEGQEREKVQRKGPNVGTSRPHQIIALTFWSILSEEPVHSEEPIPHRVRYRSRFLNGSSSHKNECTVTLDEIILFRLERTVVLLTFLFLYHPYFVGKAMKINRRGSPFHAYFAQKSTFTWASGPTRSRYEKRIFRSSQCKYFTTYVREHYL